VVKSGLCEGLDFGKADVAEPLPIHQPGNASLRTSMHSHCEMRWSTMFQKPHLVNASSVAQVCYIVIPPLFRMWNTIDSFIKEEIWASNMTGSYASSYCHVWWVVFHVSHMLGMQCDPVDKIPWVNLHICLKINFPQDKAVGSCSISKAHGSWCRLMSA